MEPSQAFRIEKAQQRLGMSDGELVRLAQEVAPGCGCGFRSFADLTAGQSQQLVDLLEAIERVQTKRMRELVAG
jgi:hypothetical protein